MQLSTMSSTVGQRATSIALTSIMSIFGMTGIASADTISRTGAGSDNAITHSLVDDCRVENINALHKNSQNWQAAASGAVTSTGNTTTGDSTSGNAANTDRIAAALETANGAASRCGCQPTDRRADSAPDATINQTGADSVNAIASSQTIAQTVDNDTSVAIADTNSQAANSGNVTVSDNTTAGDATSGTAKNTNGATLLLHLKNTAPAGVTTRDGSCDNSSAGPVVSLGGSAGNSTGAAANSSTSFNPNRRTPYEAGGFNGARTYGFGGSVKPANSVPSSSARNGSGAPVSEASTTVGQGSGNAGSSATVPTAGSPSGAISNTGYNSENSIASVSTSDTTIANATAVAVTNNNQQKAYSGAVTSSDNTNTNDAGSGVAANASQTGSGVTVTN